MKKITVIDQNLIVCQRLDLRKLFMISCIINIGLIITVILMYNNVEIREIIKTKVVEKHVDDLPLTDSAIVAELTHLGCVLPNVALAQMKIESSHFKSNICKENKNIAGIKTSKSKYVVGMKNSHCVYLTYRDCLKDYIRIQNRYLQNIDGRYAESKDYVQLIKQIK